MAKSRSRERQLAREKHDRQVARRAAEERKRKRTQMIAWILIVGMVLLTTGGFLIGQILN